VYAETGPHTRNTREVVPRVREGEARRGVGVVPHDPKSLVKEDSTGRDLTGRPLSPLCKEGGLKKIVIIK